MKTNNGLERFNVHLTQIIDWAKAKRFSKLVLNNPCFILYLGVLYPNNFPSDLLRFLFKEFHGGVDPDIPVDLVQSGRSKRNK